MVLCKTCEAINGEWKCVVFFVCCQFEGCCYGVMQSIWTQGSMLQSVTWDFGSSRSLMLFWGFMSLKLIEKRRKASGLKRERSESFDPLETSSISLLVIVGI